MNVVLLSGRNKITAPSLRPIDACSALCSSLTKYSVPDISSIQIPLAKNKAPCQKDKRLRDVFTVYLYSA